MCWIYSHCLKGSFWWEKTAVNASICLALILRTYCIDVT